MQNAQLKWAIHPYHNARHEHLERMQDLTAKSEKRHLLGAGSVGVKLSGNAYCCRENEIAVYETRAINTKMEENSQLDDRKESKSGKRGRKEKRRRSKNKQTAQNDSDEWSDGDEAPAVEQCIFQKIYNHLKWTMGEKVVKQWAEDKKHKRKSQETLEVQRCLEWMENCLKNFGNSVAEYDDYNAEFTMGGTACWCKHCKQKSGNAVNRMIGFKNFGGPMDKTSRTFDNYVTSTDKDMLKHTRDMVNSLNCCSRQTCNHALSLALNYERNFYKR